ncbi:MAG: indolepyruvate oxidoreductase subunit beta family protein [Hydrogenibacillus schlegelii]|uniref:Indolepyruvate oxidoreductase subunit beta family protein n=1 Tax=Hydrogenibacillus schlegelii TaxID=1484 RepID=A0A947CX64_HYDSH|nr:indolepyruvate oxidoreductase subunit beta family protein [Hydrogenibacillus schlegelii]
MENDKRRIVRMLIGTVGGQGGGVLTNWLVRGLYRSGWFAQSIGVLGLAQRSGTVTYYVEARSGLDRPMISVYAAPGDVDILLGQELLELGRILRGGYAAPGCTIIGNLYRYYATLEKMPAGDGTYPAEKIIEAAKRLSDDVYLVDAAAMVRNLGLPELTSNAYLLGMVVASKKLNLDPEPFRKAIEESRVDVENNIRSFNEGYRLVKEGSFPPAIDVRPTTPSWKERATELEGRLRRAKDRAAYRERVERALASFGERLMPTMVEACYRLLDYQDARYVDEYLARVQAVRDGERRVMPDAEARGWPVTERYARYLALWMTYEDAPRVAQLKTNPERFKKIKARFGVRKNQKFVVTEYLDPDGPQIYGVLPAGLVTLLIGKRGERFKWLQNVKFPMRIKTTSVWGYSLLRMMAGFRRWRRLSYRHHQEMALIARWENGIHKALQNWPELAVYAAEAADLVKGYAHVREKALHDLWIYLEQILPKIADLDPKLGQVARSLAQSALKIAGREAGKGEEALKFLADFERETVQEAKEKEAKEKKELAQTIAEKA